MSRPEIAADVICARHDFPGFPGQAPDTHADKSHGAMNTVKPVIQNNSLPANAGSQGAQNASANPLPST